MPTRAFVTYVSLYKNAQKNLGESTHPIGSTRPMHMMQPLSPGANGVTYANAPTCNSLTVLQWYAPITSSLDTQVLTLDWFRLPNRLQDAGAGPPKLQ